MSTSPVFVLKSVTMTSFPCLVSDVLSFGWQLCDSIMVLTDTFPNVSIIWILAAVFKRIRRLSQKQSADKFRGSESSPHLRASPWD